MTKPRPRFSSADLEGRVRGLGRRGEGFVQTAEGTVFVRGALPGERVRLRITGRHRGVLRGRLLAVLDAAEERVEPACTLADRCGGCPLMGWSPAAQQATKRAWVEQAVARVGAPSLAVGFTESPAVLGYRSRARMAFHAKGDARRVGYRPERTHRVLEVAGCPVLDRVAAAGLAVVREQLLPVLSGAGEITMATGHGGQPVLWVESESPQAPAVYRALAGLVESQALAGATLVVEEAAAPARFGDPRQCATGADGQPLWGPPGGFAQTNPAVNQALVQWVARAADAPGRRVLELFAGHGNLTVLLAPGSATYDAVEADGLAAAACRDNLADRGLTAVRVHTAAAERHRSARPVDLVVLDPPRIGAREALPGILRLRPQTIIYISCDPPTLARDLATLHAGGYVADRAQVFDMFPHTAHVEAAVRLTGGSR